MRRLAVADPPIVECRHVDAGYRSGDRAHPVLSGVDFAIRRGELCVILGRSGSGKSTLLRLMNRFDEPLSGEVAFEGKSVRDYDPRRLRRRVAMVLQTPVMFDGTVRDNLLVRPADQPAPTEAAVLGALADVDLDASLVERKASDLSVGEKQRVAIARALLSEPDVLLLDEPTSALDPQTTSHIADLLVRLRDSRRLTVVLVTHQPELVRRLGGRAALIRDGVVQVDASERDVETFLEGG